MSGVRLKIKRKIEVPGKGHATPVIWDNQIIILTAVKTDEIVHSDTIDDGFHASPAIVGDEIFLRGFKYLYYF